MFYTKASQTVGCNPRAGSGSLPRESWRECYLQNSISVGLAKNKTGQLYDYFTSAI